MHDQERALDLLGDAVERVALGEFQRSVVVPGADHPAELECRGRTGARVLLRQLGVGVLGTLIDAPARGAERDGAGIALVDAGDARRVIAAEAVAHHHDSLLVGLRQRRHEVERCAARYLVVRPGMDVAQPQRLALPWAIDRQRVDAAPGELEPGEDHAHFLAIIHAVEQHHGRLRTGPRRGQPERRQRGVLDRYVDLDDLRIEPREGRVVAADRLAIHRELLFTRNDEALGAVIVVAGAHVEVTGGDLAAFLVGFVGNRGELVGHARPFLAPDLVDVLLVCPRLQPLADDVDLGHRGGRPGHHALDDLHRVAPAEVAGKMLNPAAAPMLRHSLALPLMLSGPDGVASRTAWLERGQQIAYAESTARVSVTWLT